MAYTIVCTLFVFAVPLLVWFAYKEWNTYK